eukprot:TRINITY_DN3287_c0_g1_i1.p1 TRINITY_DN3287_c0_g1~~TRINITY_DN3287_c0_g1_i1.p1  ORF type:complete len:2057 (+),score=781.40 TRINITY_DN3287_c0_g1_i1:96-6266(+)
MAGKRGSLSKKKQKKEENQTKSFPNLPFEFNEKILFPESAEQEELRTRAIQHYHQNPQEAIFFLSKTWFLLEDFPPEHDKFYGDNDEVDEEVAKICLEIILGVRPPESEIEKLKKDGLLKNNVCGAVWRDREAAYKCTTCEMDSSCAICTDCFNNGNHEGHEFKIIQVVGGVCDCGDYQAWKPSGFCSKHIGVSDVEEVETIAPPQLSAATKVIFWAVLQNLNHRIGLEEETMMEVSVRSVSKWFQELLFAGDIFRKFLAEVWTASEEDLSAILGLKVTGRGARLNDSNDNSKASKRLTRSKSGEGKFEESKKDWSLLHDLFKMHDNMQDSTAEMIHQLFFPLLFVPKFRKCFLKDHFIPYYKENAAKTALDGKYNALLSDFPVQLYTMKNCVPILKEEGIVSIIVNKFKQFLESHLETPNEYLPVFDVAPQLHQGGARFTLDLIYCLAHRELSANFISSSQKQEESLLETWFNDVISLTQGMNAKHMVRITEGHAEYDYLQWIFAFSLAFDMMRIAQVIEKPFEIAAKSGPKEKVDLSPLEDVIKVNFDSLMSWFKQESENEAKRNKKAKFLVSVHANYFHLPLHRYLALFLHRVAKTQSKDLGSIVKRQGREIGLALIEHPLRIQSLISQVRIGMWVRNGREVWAQTQTYESVYFRNTMRDLDIFLLQVGISFYGTNEFVEKAAQIFEVSSWFKSKLESDNTIKLMEEFLRFLIILYTERTYSGFTEKQVIRKEIIHRLAVADCTHSQIMAAIESGWVDHPLFEGVLKEVSVFSKPKQMEQGAFHLKDECWKEFDPHFHHYSKTELEKAVERFNEQLKSNTKSEEKELDAPVVRLDIFPPFEALNSLVLTSSIHKIIFQVLYYANKKNEEMCTEVMVTEAIHLLYLAAAVSTANVSVALESPIKSGTPTSSRSKRMKKSNSKSSSFTGNADKIVFPSNELFANAMHEVETSPLNPDADSKKNDKEKHSILTLLMRLSTQENFKGHSSKIESILEMMIKKDLNTMEYVKSAAQHLKEQNAVVNRKRKGTNDEGEAGDEEEVEKKRSRKEKQAEIMAKMKAQQAKFTEKNKELLGEIDPNEEFSANDSETGEKKEMIFDENPFAGSGTCALCHEEASICERPLGFISLAQYTALLQSTNSEIPNRIRNEKQEIIIPSKVKNGKEELPENEEEEEQRKEALVVPTDKDTDKSHKALVFMQNLMKDPEFNNFAHDDLDVDELSEMDENEDDFIGAYPNASSSMIPRFLMQGAYVSSSDEDDGFDDFDSEDEMAVDDAYNLLHGAENRRMIGGSENNPIELEDDEMAPIPAGGVVDVDNNNNPVRPLDRVVDRFGRGEDDKLDIYFRDFADLMREFQTISTTWFVVKEKDGPLPPNNNTKESVEAMEARQLPDYQSLVKEHQEETVTSRISQLSEQLEDLKEELKMEFDLAGGEASNQANLLCRRITLLLTHIFRMINSISTSEILNLNRGIHPNVQYCGHVVHSDCLVNYLSSLQGRERQGNEFEGEGLINLHRGEFLCLMCRRIADCLAPIVPFQNYLFNGNPDSPLETPVREEMITLSSLNSFMKSWPNGIQEEQKMFVMTPKLAAAINRFLQSLYGRQNETWISNQPEKVQDSRFTSLMWSAFGATLGGTEVSTRQRWHSMLSSNFQKKQDEEVQNVWKKIDNNSARQLKSLFYIGSAYFFSLRSRASSILKARFDNYHRLVSGDLEKDAQLEDGGPVPPLLSLDLLSVLCPLLLIWPQPNRLVEDFYQITGILWHSLFVQLMIHYAEGKAEIFGKEWISVENLSKDKFILEVKSAFDSFASNEKPKDFPHSIPQEHSEYFKRMLLPFMRNASIFLFACLDQKIIGWEHNINSSVNQDPVSFEFESMRRYLCLPSIENTLLAISSKGEMREKVLKWVRHYNHFKGSSSDSSKPKEVPLPPLTPCVPFSLVKLPLLYNDLLQKYSNVKCNCCGEVPTIKILCLVCGNLECPEHFKPCLGSVNARLYLKTSVVIVGRGQRYSNWGSPYLDEHGEEDIHLVRGKSLYLSQERYDQLTQILVNHQADWNSALAEDVILG